MVYYFAYWSHTNCVWKIITHTYTGAAPCEPASSNSFSPSPLNHRRALQREITFFRVTRPRPQGGKSVGLEPGGLTWEMRKISGLRGFFSKGGLRGLGKVSVLGAVFSADGKLSFHALQARKFLHF